MILMIMQRIAYASLFVLFIFNYAVAQDKFGSGFYVNHEGDTVRGFVEYRYHYNYEFTFRSTLKGDSRTFTVDEVNHFGLDRGNKYHKIDFALGDLSPKPVFAQMLFEGDIDLYRYQGTLFIDGGGSNRFQLASRKGKNTEDATKYLQKNTGYFNILFQQCPTVAAEAAKITISSDALVYLLTNYHDCKNVPYVDHSKKGKKQINFGLSVGMGMPSIKYTSTSIGDYLAQTNFGPSPNSPAIGIHFISRGRKPSSVIALQQELLFSKASFSGSSYTTWEGAGYKFTQTSTTVIKYSKLDYKIGLRLTARSNVINPYFSIGLAMTKFLNNQSKSDITFQINDDIKERVENPIPSYSVPGAWASLGLSKKVGLKHQIFFDFMAENTYLENNGNCNTLYFRFGFLY
jgi:hypothetical protein